VSLVDNQQLIQALLTHGANSPFRESVGIRGMIRYRDHIDVFRAKDRVESVCELGVVIWDQKPDARVVVFQLLHHLMGLLGDPGVVWIDRAVCEMHPMGPNLDKDEHLQRSQEQGFNGEKVAHQTV
jgi:hypothetical protein